MTEHRDDRRERLPSAPSTLPRDIDPPHDLWPAIEARLRVTSPRRGDTGRDRPKRMELSIAAGLAAVVLVAGLAVHTVRRAEIPVDSRVGDAWSLAREAYASAGFAYPAMAAALDEARPAIERDIAAVRRQRAAVEAAMREDPNNPRLRELWLYAYETELSLLNEVGRILNDYQRG